VHRGTALRWPPLYGGLDQPGPYVVLMKWYPWVDAPDFATQCAYSQINKLPLRRGRRNVGQPRDVGSPNPRQGRLIRAPMTKRDAASRRSIMAVHCIRPEIPGELFDPFNCDEQIVKALVTATNGYACCVTYCRC
jgi:hypothetical protein